MNGLSVVRHDIAVAGLDVKRILQTWQQGGDGAVEETVNLIESLSPDRCQMALWVLAITVVDNQATLASYRRER